MRNCSGDSGISPWLSDWPLPTAETAGKLPGKALAAVCSTAVVDEFGGFSFATVPDMGTPEVIRLRSRLKAAHARPPLCCRIPFQACPRSRAFGSRKLELAAYSLREEAVQSASAAERFAV